MAAPDAQTQPTSFEQAEIAAVESLKPAFETPAAKKFGKLGKLADQPPLLALSALVLAGGILTSRPQMRRAGVRMVAAHLIAAGFKNFVKDRVDRTRPKLIDHGEYRMEPGNSKAKDLRSFPSGHSAGAFAVARAASREFPIGPEAGIAAGLLAVLQIVRRAHFPSDAVAGAALGLLAEAVADRALGPVLRKRKPAARQHVTHHDRARGFSSHVHS